MLDLSKETPLEGPSGSTPDTVNLTVSWRVATQGKSSGLLAKARNMLTKVDLDVLALCFNSSSYVVSVAGPHDLSPFANGSVRHTGDTSAAGGGTSSETIQVRPGEVPPAVAGIILAVVAYGNSDLFGRLSQTVLTITDGGGQQLVEEYVSIEGGVQGQLLVVLAVLVPVGRWPRLCGRWVGRVRGRTWLLPRGQPCSGLDGGSSRWPPVSLRLRRRRAQAMGL